MQRQRMKDLLLKAHLVVRTLKMKISRRRLADYVKKLHQKARRACSTIIFPHSTNHIIDLCRCGCRRHLLANRENGDSDAHDMNELSFMI